MNVNNLLLRSPSGSFVLRNDLIRCCLITSIRRVFDNASYRAHSLSIRPLSPELKGNILCPATIDYNSKPTYRNLSRYSASTIMRPHTKAFSFNDYDVIGFDLDGTILRYNLDEMVPLEYELLCRYLVEHKGYSKNLLGTLDQSAHKYFLQKGLFLDAQRGNVLKLGSDGYILKATHGTRPLSDEEISAEYGEDRLWSVTMQFIEEPLCAWNGPLAEKMRSLLDYFDISVSLVFARAIDEADSKMKNSQPYTVWSDILEALVHIYSREHFSTGESGYFEKLKSDPKRFLLKTSPVVLNWLKELKSANKKLFLLTGSHIDFANFTASYALGENWKDLFDIVICFARKPGFFHGDRLFHKIEGFKETDPITNENELVLNRVYSMGNWPRLLKLFANDIDKEPCDIKSLYVGDNLIQDVYAPDAFASMDSVAISEEMLVESASKEPLKNVFKDIIGSPYWNSYFHDEGSPTLWTHIIEKHSKMCVPTLEHAAAKPIDYKFMMDNETGFFPLSPVAK